MTVSGNAGDRLYRGEALERIEKAQKDWTGVYPGERERQSVFKTLSGISLSPLYTPTAVPGLDYLHDLGFPGEPPFVRGVHPTMYRGRTWTRRQLAGYGPPEETNRRYRFLLDAGAGGINGVFDYPTLRGYDSNDPEAFADAGRGGVAVDTIEDMETLFKGIPIDQVSISLVTCQPICNISIQSMFFANAQARGIPLDSLAGTSQNDFLMETAVSIAPGVLPPHAAFKLSCDAIEYCARNAGKWNPVSFAGYNYREAGCNAFQEIALVMANALACIEEMLRRGLKIDDFAPRLSFFLSAHNDFFEEICKYRAARRLWSRLVRDRYRPENPRSRALRFHVQTAGVALTAQQPLNNVARSAYHAMSAALGGAQSVHVDGFDEALCNPTELSSLTALRTQQILQLETGITQTIDPLAGSFFVETLTLEMEKRIAGLLDEIEAMGGIVRAVEQGWVHRTISDSAYDYQRAVETGEMPVVGVNCHRLEEEPYKAEIFTIPETLAVQEAKLESIRSRRSPDAAQKALDAVSRCCEGDGNLMEVIVGSVKALVSEGEISRTLKGFYGTWNPPLF
jgi:methylmalonyl-CoA mutase, N-terminal domain